jgi:hypothetical protein
LLCLSATVLFLCFLVIGLVYSFGIFQPVTGQKMKAYSDPGHKFNFYYPPYWQIQSSKHDNITGSSEVILAKPNSTRTGVTILYNPNDTLLTNSKTGKPIVVSKGLTTLEKQISLDYIFF